MLATEPRISLVPLIFCLAILPSGCTFGPRTVHRNRIAYNRSLSLTEDQQLLLNLVRLRYNDKIKFLSVGGISTQFDFSSVLSTLSNYYVNKANKLAFKSDLGYAERPTISYAPLEGQEFTQRLLSTINNERKRT